MKINTPTGKYCKTNEKPENYDFHIFFVFFLFLKFPSELLSKRGNWEEVGYNGREQIPRGNLCSNRREYIRMVL